MGERIRAIRKMLPKKTTQKEFGEKLGVSSAVVTSYELDKATPPPATLRLICQMYNVRREWLEYGTEPMRQPQDEDDEIVDAVLAGEDEFIKAVIRGIAKTPGGWEKMREVFQAIQAELNK